MKETYQITIERPPGVSVSEMIHHIFDSVLTTGHLHPEDPIFYLSDKGVKVKRVIKKID